MSKVDFEALRELLGSWEKVREVALTPEQQARYLGTVVGRQWFDELMPDVLRLVMSPVMDATYMRRLRKLSERNHELLDLDHRRIMAAFNTRPPWHSDEELVQKPTMSKRTRRRMKRRGEL